MKPIFLCLSVFVLLLTLATKSSLAQDAVIPLEVFGELPNTSMMTVSPSGQRLGYRVTRDGKDMFVIYDREKKSLVGGLSISEIRPDYAYFTSDDYVILVASDNKKLWGFKGRHDVSAAFSYSIADNKVRQLLIAGEGIYEGQTALGRVVGRSNDGNFLYMPAWYDTGSFALMKKRLDAKRIPRKIGRGAADATDYFVFNDQPIARERFNNEDDLHRIDARVDNEWVTVFEEKTNIPKRNFVGVTQTGKELVFLAYNNDRVGYYTMSLQDGSVTGPLFAQPDKSVEYVIKDINRIVYGVRYSGFRPSYDFFDKSVATVISGLIEQLPDYSVTIEDFSSDWKHILLSLDGIDSPKDYYLYTDGGLKFITSSRSNMPTDRIAQVLNIEIKARDGLKIPTLLTVPLVEEVKNLPAIMLPHGGPESYDKIRFDWLAQYFASRGYLVIQPQFRGSDGFGWEFKSKGRGEWGRKMQDDLTDALKTLVKSGYVDENKVCIVGASYGGYAALAGATFTPDLYQCAVSINGVADVERMMKDEKRERSAQHRVYEYWQKVIADGTFDNNHLAAISPITHVDKVQVPILLIHGERDEVVPEHQSEYMYDALKDADKDAEFITLDEGDHYMSSGKNRLQALKAIDAFITKHLK